jgi:hypothetical protein
MTYSNTLSTTQTQTFTIADAKYLASRVAAGLTYLRIYDPTGYLTVQKVQDLTVEAALLLKAGLLGTIKYGFQKDGSWVFALRYSVNYFGQIEAANDNPSAIDPPPNLDGTAWSSSLTERDNPSLSQADRDAIDELLPFKRSSGAEPSSAKGTWNNDDGYYRNGYGMNRGQFRSY